MFPTSSAEVARAMDLHRFATSSLTIERLFNTLTSLTAAEPEVARLGGEILRFERPPSELLRASGVVQSFFVSPNDSTGDNSAGALEKALLQPGASDFIHFLLPAADHISYKSNTVDIFRLLPVLPSVLESCSRSIALHFFPPPPPPPPPPHSSAEEQQQQHYLQTSSSNISSPHEIIFQREYILQAIHSLQEIICDFIPRVLATTNHTEQNNHNNNNHQGETAAAAGDDLLSKNRSTNSLLRRLSTACINLAEGIESAFHQQAQQQQLQPSPNTKKIIAVSEHHKQELSRFVDRLKNASRQLWV